MSDNKRKSFNACRLFGKLIQLATVIVSAISLIKLLDIYRDHLEEKIKREKRNKALIIILVTAGIIAAIGTGFALAVNYIKKKQNGYLFNFFDRNSYDVVSPEEEESLNILMQSQLFPDSEIVTIERLAPSSIPLDEEETEENYK